MKTGVASENEDNEIYFSAALRCVFSHIAMGEQVSFQGVSRSFVLLIRLGCFWCVAY